ncbi:MAG: YcaQ family DNA glycosylase [Microlunatus sp.]|nr:YcaQ family DNA glycosylase [Microlunatus sp.]
MAAVQLTIADARRIAVRAQLLDLPRPTEVLPVVRQLTLLQADQTKVVAPNADLVLWSRIGSAYDRDELDDLLATRELIELDGMIRPAEDIALYRAEMDALADGGDLEGWQRSIWEWVETNDGCRRDILDRLADSGPLTSRQLPDTTVAPWRSSGWNNGRNVAMMLEMMAARGEVAVAGHQGRDRLFDLAERIYPDEEYPPLAEAVRIRNERRLQSLGIARAKATGQHGEPIDVGEVGQPTVVDGVRGTWRVDPGQLERLDESLEGRVAVLSPLDRLIMDRKRMAELFEFDYQLEMYKPAAKRRWGYYALPILTGDRLIGKVDAAADHELGVLRIEEIHADEPFDAKVSAAVEEELTDLSVWLGLEPS